MSTKQYAAGDLSAAISAFMCWAMFAYTAWDIPSPYFWPAMLAFIELRGISFNVVRLINRHG
jgi:hypothetical protein